MTYWSSAHSQNHGTLTESMLCPYMEFPDYVMSKHAHMWTLPNMGISRYVLNIDNIGTGISIYGHTTYVKDKQGLGELAPGLMPWDLHIWA